MESTIAATVFAFLRNDLETASDRVNKLRALGAAKEPQPSDLGLWLVARYALAEDSTQRLGRQVAQWAMEAAEKASTPVWKTAILRELKELERRAVSKK